MSPLAIGFVPTLDCATVVVAKELGLFDQHGLDVRLQREVGWATIREKLLHDELDGAVAHACMLFSIYFGLGGVRRPCLTGLMLGHHDSAITVSRKLWELGARDPATLGEIVRQQRGTKHFTFGVVLEFSAQHYLLSEWFRRGGIVPGVDVRLAVIPSGLVFDSFKAGHIDGYCVAEPWNSIAAADGSGVVLSLTGQSAPGHPDKAFVVMQDFADERAEEHEHLLAALIEAGQFCAEPANLPGLAQILARPEYLNVPEAILSKSLAGPFETGAGSPDRAHGRWVYDAMCKLGSEPLRTQLRPEAIRRIFREDIYARARRRAERCVGDQGVTSPARCVEPGKVPVPNRKPVALRSPRGRIMNFRRGAVTGRHADVVPA